MLVEKKKKELLKMARGLGLKGIHHLKKSDIVEKMKEVVLNFVEDEKTTKKQLNKIASALKVRYYAKLQKEILKERLRSLFTTQREVPAPKIKASLSSSSISATRIKKPLKVSPEYEEKPLPKTYDTDRLVLMPVNPYWVHTYWQLSGKTQTRIENQLKDGVKPILRVYDVTFIEFNGSNAHRTLEATVNLDTNKWYMNVPFPNASYIAELGLKSPEGRFIPLLRSNVVKTPRASVSSKSDVEWYDLKRRRRITYEPTGKGVNIVERLFILSSAEFVERYKNITGYSGGGSFARYLER